ncbi:MAG: gliding motility-associated C-terminal domain-containing protein [Prevotella sp.]|nr:gliding motility-associated C-terminal domain-containing protein [Prevotella sp.]
MRIFVFFALFTTCFILGSIGVMAQDELPTINPTATYTSSDGEEEESTDFSGDAPLRGVFKSNPENAYGWSEYYEWRFTLEGESSPYLIRYEEDTEYTFTTAGSHRIVVYATFVNGNDTVAYDQEYWDEIGPLRVTISESKLEMPNAFSPNGDGINDIYKAKDGYQSIIEFHAYIFNRWGQKLYEWTDPAGGWDGKYKGKDVAQGVYYVLVNAKGADGRTFHIKRDVNLLRGYSEDSGTIYEE